MDLFAVVSAVTEKSAMSMKIVVGHDEAGPKFRKWFGPSVLLQKHE
jgi:hypothetical protein